MEHFKLLDPIMYTETSLPSLVEAQFEAGGPWILSRGSLATITREKQEFFNRYEAIVRKDPPECLSTLRRMLQSGPITTVYTGG